MFEIVEYLGDVQLPNQRHWSSRFGTLEMAREAAMKEYDNRVVGLSADDWTLYYIIISPYEKAEEIIQVLHGGRFYVGHAAKVWEEVVLPDILESP